MTKQLATKIRATALLRVVQHAGGNATVIKRGDPDSGEILILCAKKGQITALFERGQSVRGEYEWASVKAQIIDNKEEIDRYLARRMSFDPDIWVIELDIPNAARFIVEMGALI